jgi:hypothetical protein
MLLCTISVTVAQPSCVRVPWPAANGKYEKLRAETLLTCNVLPSNSGEIGKTPKTDQFF